MKSKAISLNKLILASASPRRKDLLDRCGVAFEVIKPDVDELTSCPTLRKLPLLNAEIKARAIASEHPDCWVLGADTVIYLDGQIYGKPQSLPEARQMLQAFSNRKHEVLTGIFLLNINQKSTLEKLVSTSVWFKNLSDSSIDDYLAKVKVLDKAGAYAIQEYGEKIIERLDGGLDNVIGLPTPEVKQMLISINLLKPASTQ